MTALCACAGRRAGSKGGRAARAFVAKALSDAGAPPFEQSVPVDGGANLVARLGHASERAILVGAHYDHIGPGYPGADDNAAAVAILVEVARALIASPQPVGSREVLLVAFDAEEPPFFLTEQMGSEHFARSPAVPIEHIDLAIILDLVGHAVGPPSAPPAVRESVFVLGDVMLPLPAEAGVVPRPMSLQLLPPLSDYHAFQTRGVPSLFVTNGRWRHYHEPTDTEDRLDYDKMAATARWLEQLVRAAAAADRIPVERDDRRTLQTLREVVAQLRDASLLARVDALATRIGPQLSPSEFMEAQQLVGIVEAALA